MKKSILSGALLAASAITFGFVANDAEAAYSYTATPNAPIGTPEIPIVDGMMETVSTINVTESFSVADVALTMLIEHTWVGDLKMYLEAPDGSALTLVEQDWDNDRRFMPEFTYTFRDDATQDIPIRHPEYATTVPAGTYRPDGAPIGPDGMPMGERETFSSVFSGIDSQGVWSLYIYDTSPDDDQTAIFSGKLDSWTLELTPVPIPGAIWLFGAALVGLVGFKKKKSMA